MCLVKEEDLSWREESLLKRLAEVRVQLAERGDEPIDEPVILVATTREDDPRWMEQAILRKLAEVRAEMAAERAAAARPDPKAEAAAESPTSETMSPRPPTEGEHRRLQAARSTHESLLRAVMEASPVALVIHPLDGSPPMANSHVERLLGPDLALQRPWLHPDGHPYPPEDLPLARALRGEVVAAEEAQRVGPDGRVIPVRMGARPVRDASGAITHVVAMYEDASPQAGVNEFLSNLSHELRTPMTSILGWIRLMSDGHLTPEKQTHGLAVIERNARMQMHLIEDLLDTSQILAGTLPLEPRRVSPRLVVEQVLESILPLASLKGVAISARVGSEISEVLIDPDRLHQVIWNLLANAIKFTGEGGTVTLRVAQPGGRLRIEVQDTGEGIDPAVIPLIFQRFTPSDSATTRRLGGLGLGLAMMKHLVELQGGTIEAESEGENRGSTFIVTLPTGADDQPGTTASAHKGHSELAGRTVLVVDDETDTRDMLKAVLQDSSARVLTAADGVEALHQLQAANVDLIVSDLGMPEKDGYDLIRLIRLAEGSQDRMPAVALTARTREEDRSRALAAGFDVHVAKPVDPRKLVALVASLLRPHGPGELRN